MVADKGERNDADCFEKAGMNDERPAQLTPRLWRNAEALSDDGYYDDAHTDQGKTTSFSKLSCVSTDNDMPGCTIHLCNVSV